MEQQGSKHLKIQFAQWFEEQFPGERYTLKNDEAGIYIIRSNGSSIPYREYYEQIVMGLNQTGDDQHRKTNKSDD